MEEQDSKGLVALKHRETVNVFGSVFGFQDFFLEVILYSLQDRSNSLIHLANRY